MKRKSEKVLIESDWNLKREGEIDGVDYHYVLIESDWNLKRITTDSGEHRKIVLIESDWNLKGLKEVPDIGVEPEY